MGMPMAVWTQAGDAAVNAGPIDRESLVRLMAAAVPPAVAIAAAEAQREWLRRRRRRVGNGWGAATERQLDDVMVGARRKATQSIGSKCKCGVWVQLPDGRIASREWVKANAEAGS